MPRARDTGVGHRPHTEGPSEPVEAGRALFPVWTCQTFLWHPGFGHQVPFSVGLPPPASSPLGGALPGSWPPSHCVHMEEG